MSGLWTRTTTKRIAPIALTVSLLGVGCKKSEERSKAPPPSPPSPAVAVSARPQAQATAQTVLANGLNDEQVQSFYHLSEGSEFVPYCALKVYAKEHGKTLAQFFDAYHLIPDAPSANNPLGLPIGLTVQQNEFNLIGFTCAACHVGRITHDASYIVVGGPSSFNIRQFYDDVLPWVSRALTTPALKRKVLGCLLRDLVKKPQAPSPGPSEEDAVREELRAAEQSTDAGEESQLDEHLDRAVEVAAKPGSAVAAAAELDQASASAEGKSPLFKALSRDHRRQVLQGLRDRFNKAKSLLVAFQESLPNTLAVGAIPETTRPGPGRVDAFMTAFNLMNPGAKLHMDSPVGFPPLWGIGKDEPLHYDGNTTAKLQRNIGQAVGIGALLGHEAAPKKKDAKQNDGRTQDVPTRLIATTVDIESLRELESLVTRIAPPPWPFAKSDPALVAAGQKIYAAQCARCHEPGPDGKMPGPYEDPNTDRKRLDNFEQSSDAQIQRNWPGKKLIEVLALQLAAAEAVAVPDETQRDQKPQWQARGKYVARPLRGVWATAPYLHNNSVPTLSDLLKRSQDRPTKFALDYSHYDTEAVGFERANAQSAETTGFDATLSGNGNRGHEFGTELSADDKLELLAYLKEL